MKTVISVRKKSTIGMRQQLPIDLVHSITLQTRFRIRLNQFQKLKNFADILFFYYLLKIEVKNIPPLNLSQLIRAPSQQFSKLASFYSIVDFSSLFESKSLNRFWVILDCKSFFTLTFLVSLIE